LLSLARPRFGAPAGRNRTESERQADGNLTNDGRWGYVWDAENRLISMQAISTVPIAAKLKLDFTYDYKGRRVQKVVSTNSGSAYVAEYTNVFVYDGWNMIGELNGANDALIRTYGWGLDLSGQTGSALNGAGGVGGLLALTEPSNPQATNAQFVAYDGNGNVAALVDAGSGGVTGQYEYGPFGEGIRTTGSVASGNPFRYSTKYQDGESDLLYYGTRYLDVTMGVWLSRDPIAELGGNNLYGMLANNPVNAADALGLASLEQLLGVMNAVQAVLAQSKNCQCQKESAYLQCVLGELNNTYASSGFDQVVQQALSQVNSWKVDVATATGLDPLYADQLEKAFDALAKSAGGKAALLNNARTCGNKCLSKVTGTVGTAEDLYNGDAIVATLVVFEKASSAAVPLKPLSQWISFYKDAYIKATKALDQIGLNGLENSLNTIQSLRSDDCDEINVILGRPGSAPSGISVKCKPLLGSGGT